MVPRAGAGTPTDDNLSPPSQDPGAVFLEVKEVPFFRLGIVVRVPDGVATAVSLPLPQARMSANSTSVASGHVDAPSSVVAVA